MTRYNNDIELRQVVGIKCPCCLARLDLKLNVLGFVDKVEESDR